MNGKGLEIFNEGWVLDVGCLFFLELMLLDVFFFFILVIGFGCFFSF